MHTHSKSSVIIDNIFNLLEVMVAPPTLMEAKAPVGRHVRATYDLLILLDHSLRLRTKKKVKIKDT